MNTIQNSQSQTGAEPAAETETLAELNVETRTILAFSVGEAATENLLPAGWKATPAQSGPSAGANVNLIFTDRLLVQNADGTPMPGQATNQLAVVAVPAQHAESGARGVVIAFGLSARPEGTPGPYGVFSPADANIERVLRSGSGEIRQATEQWSFASADGERLSLRLQYARGVPTRSETETRAYSAKDPTFYRIYRADQGANVLRSGTTAAGAVGVDAGAVGPDALSELDLSTDGPQIGSLFNGLEGLISVISVPWTVRRAFLPKLGSQ